jgi:hypothetical protein
MWTGHIWDNAMDLGQIAKPWLTAHAVRVPVGHYLYLDTEIVHSFI